MPTSDWFCASRACGAEIIQLERALSKLVSAAESYVVFGPQSAAQLMDALENAKAHLE